MRLYFRGIPREKKCLLSPEETRSFIKKYAVFYLCFKSFYFVVTLLHILFSPPSEVKIQFNLDGFKKDRLAVFQVISYLEIVNHAGKRMLDWCTRETQIISQQCS